MVRCPNCGRKTIGDYCEWCKYPIISRSPPKHKVEKQTKKEAKAAPLRGVEPIQEAKVERKGRPTGERIGRGAGFEEYWVDYLRGEGVEAEVVELHAPSWKYQPTKRAVRLTGKNVNEIWKVERITSSYAREFDTHFRVLLDRPLAPAAKKALAAKSKITKQNKRLGIFGGRTSNVKWVGGGIAHALNQDADLRMMILGFAQFISGIRIKPAGKSAVTIRVRGHEGLSLGGGDFEIYDRIAKHVRDVAGAY